MSTNHALALQPGDSIEALLGLLRDINNGIKAAAQMLFRIHQHDPEVVVKLRERAGHPEWFINGLLRVGEGSMHPALLLGTAPAYGALKRLPYTVQERVLKAGAVEVVIDAETGDHIRVPLVELKGPQVVQVLGPTGPRSLDEQRALLKRTAPARCSGRRTVELPYLVKKDRLVVNAPCELTRVQLLKLLEEMG
jgi:hypothetical protein